MAIASEFITATDERGCHFSLPPTRSCISSYVLLEQGRWFEREIDFLYRLVTPGMLALDIGANVGVYAVPLGHLVTAAGQVHAYEPGSDNRCHLERSLTLNGLTNVTVSSLALSDFFGIGCLKLGESGELHQLVAATNPEDIIESVTVSTLDTEMDSHRWGRVDFVKLDAEGQEQAILDGGTRFFERFSPVVMFEVKHRFDINLGLLNSFQEMGFGIYRLFGDASMLVPFGSDEELDPYELNLFAVRREPAIALANRGLLALEPEASTLSPEEWSDAVDAFCALPFARALEILPIDVAECPFGSALAAHAAHRFLPRLSPARRMSLMQTALQEMLRYCAASNSAVALSSLARIAIDCGSRRLGNDVMQHLMEVGIDAIDQPFLPIAPRFESFTDTAADDWLLFSAAETFERNRMYSAIFGHDLARIEMLAGHARAAPFLLRRLVLAGLIDGHTVDHFAVALTRLRELDATGHATWLDAVRQLDAS